MQPSSAPPPPDSWSYVMVQLPLRCRLLIYDVTQRLQVTAWCSQCSRYGDHMMTERSTLVRCAYRCMHCENRTLPCRNECGAMARGHWW